MDAHTRPGNLLDVGTGTGEFLYYARRRHSDVAGTEISSEAIRIGKERYGVHIFQGEVGALGLPSGSFDNVTLFHVLEHVQDPKALLQACHNLLPDAGVLLIAVPNDRTLITRLYGMSVALRRRLGRNGKLLPKRVAPGSRSSPSVGSSRRSTYRTSRLRSYRIL